MIDSSIEREETLRAIRQSLCRAERNSSANSQTVERDALPRSYARAGELSEVGRIALFEERVREYGATVQRASASGIPEAIAERLKARSKNRLAIPSGLPSAWLPTGFHFYIANDLALPSLERTEGVITSCSVAIALTGTIVLQHGSGQGPRRLTLIPDYHLCILFTDQIVETVPQSFDRLAASATLPTTFISGPSATADIEMIRIQGVHGPRNLDVLLVE